MLACSLTTPSKHRFHFSLGIDMYVLLFLQLAEFQRYKWKELELLTKAARESKCIFNNNQVKFTMKTGVARLAD